MHHIIPFLVRDNNAKEKDPMKNWLGKEGIEDVLFY